MFRQLDLFKGELLVFPLDRRTSEVRRAASALNRLQGKAATSFWKELVKTLSDPLQSAGVPADEISRQIWAFRDEVSNERWLLQQNDSRRPGGSR